MVFHLHAHVIAGKDIGAFFLNVAVMIAVVWRRLVSLVRGSGLPRDRVAKRELQDNHRKSPGAQDCGHPHRAHMARPS